MHWNFISAGCNLLLYKLGVRRAFSYLWYQGQFRRYLMATGKDIKLAVDMEETLAQMQKIQKANADFVQKLAAGQMELVNELIDGTMKHFDALKDVKKPQDMVELQNQYFSESAKKITTKGRKIFEIYMSSQPAIAALMPAAAKASAKPVAKPAAKKAPAKPAAKPAAKKAPAKPAAKKAPAKPAAKPAAKKAPAKPAVKTVSKKATPPKPAAAKPAAVKPAAAAKPTATAPKK